jgi:nucleotide-binding universal stress UspA family protein
MFTRVLVPLDLGRDADRALPVGAALAERLAIPLDAVVIGSQGIDSRLDVLGARRHGHDVGVEIDDVLVRHDDDVPAAILDEAEATGSLLCCATHARGPVADVFFQSVSNDLAAAGRIPLVLVGPEVVVTPRPRFAAVLACVGRAPEAASIAMTAIGCARQLRARVQILQVRDDAAADDVELTCEAAEGAITWHVAPGDDPATGILTTATHVHQPLIVMGAHDHNCSPLPRPALGKVTHAVVRESPYPVLVIPSRPPEASWAIAN